MPQFGVPFSLPRVMEPFAPLAGSTDSLGAFTPPLSFDEPNTFYVVVGPNHRNTGKASYTSLTLYDVPQQKPTIFAALARLADYVVWPSVGKNEDRLEGALFTEPVALTPAVTVPAGTTSPAPRFAGEYHEVGREGFEPPTSWV